MITIEVSVLFSEPKIPQFQFSHCRNSSLTRFQCSSASRKFLNDTKNTTGVVSADVSVLFSEPKIPQSNPARGGVLFFGVSVLFSEPKIPQFYLFMFGMFGDFRFSALQRAENSSMRVFIHCANNSRSSFSALQRAENSSIHVSRALYNLYKSFSALQRAENSSVLLCVCGAGIQ